MTDDEIIAATGCVMFDYIKTVEFYRQDILSFARAIEEQARREEREACAVAAWTHYMDVCKRRNLNPADHEHFLSAAAIRARRK